jgi:myosin protein heavy chain
MLSDKDDQSILCTGESGAGKTENAKFVIQYLTYVAASGKTKSGSNSGAALVASSRRTTMGVAAASGADGGGELEQQLLKANPILETFGNAATVFNDNSSRFGKFIKIHFNAQGFIVGGSIETYLLEKSRVVTQNPGERAFHAFYQLLAGADDALREALLLEPVSSYKFLSQEKVRLDGVNDDEEFAATNKAFKLYGMTDAEIDAVWGIVAGVLTFGQLEFSDGRRGAEQATLVNDADAQKVAKLFGVDQHADLVKCLTNPKIRAGSERVSRQQTKEQVDSAVRALAKSTYERVFLWIVQRINTSLNKSNSRGKNYIGILDIAGFEIFDHNSFEQLLINFTNEKLQQLFNHRMFIMEQNEYESEGIPWDFIDFGLDLQPTIDMIAGARGKTGMLEILDEQSIFPKATDKTFVEKCDDTYGKGKTEVYVAKTLRMKGDFAVRHYAGEVVYSADGFLYKNRDPINDNVVALFKDSSNPFMKLLWTANPSGSSGKVSSRQRGALRTVAGIYRKQLIELMDELNATSPRFVRCIKPNHKKLPGVIEPGVLVKQLQYGGVLEGIRIVRKGYPSRVLFHEFRQRYQILTPGAIPGGFVDSAKAATLMLETMQLHESEFRVGHTKIFFKAGVLAQLEEERDRKLSSTLLGLQAYCRGYLARLAFKYHVGDHQAVDIIQRNVRIFLKLRDWPWWRLYCRIKPMLKEMQKKQDSKQLESQNAELLKKLEEAMAQIKAGVEREAALKDEGVQLREEIDLLREDAELARAERQAEKAKVEELNEEIDELDQKVDLLTEESKKLMQDKRDQAEEIENLKDDLETGQADKSRMERLEKEKAGVQEKLLEVEFALVEKAKRCKTLESANSEGIERIEKLEADLAKVKKQGKESQNLVDDLSTQLSRLEGDIAASARKAKQHSTELKAEQERATAAADENLTLTAELHKAQTQVIQQEGVVEDLTEKLEQKDRETRRLKEDLEELSATDELETKLQAAQAALREKDSQLEEVNSECDELTAQVNDLTRGRDALQMQAQKLELQKDDAVAAAGPKLKKFESEVCFEDISSFARAQRSTPFNSTSYARLPAVSPLLMHLLPFGLLKTKKHSSSSPTEFEASG